MGRDGGVRPLVGGPSAARGAVGGAPLQRGLRLVPGGRGVRPVGVPG